MKNDSKIWPIVLLIIFLLIIFILIAGEIIKESSKIDNKEKETTITEDKSAELEQNLTCYTTSNILSDDGQIEGQKNIRYNFIFKEKKFTKYRKEVFLAFSNNEAF